MKPLRNLAIRVVLLLAANLACLWLFAWLYLNRPGALLLPLVFVWPLILLVLLLGSSLRLSEFWGAFTGTGNPIIYSRHVNMLNAWLSVGGGEDEGTVEFHLALALRRAQGERVDVALRIRADDGTYLRPLGCGETKCLRNAGPFGEYRRVHRLGPLKHWASRFDDVWLVVRPDQIQISPDDLPGELTGELVVGCDDELWAECDVPLPGEVVELLALEGSPPKGEQ